MAAPGAASRPRDRLVGRHDELALLDSLVKTVGLKRTPALVVSGEPGIGKTRLLAELRARADACGLLVLEGRAAEFERNLPYGVFVEACDDYLASLEPRRLERVCRERIQDLVPIFPALAASAGSERPRLPVDRYSGHRAVRALLESLAIERPLLLALDDFHWADAASLELLSYLMRRPPRGRLLLACALRPRQASHRLREALDDAALAGVAEVVELGPLSPVECDELLCEAVDAAARAELYDDSGGNPFFLEQLLRGARHGRETSAAGGRFSEEAVPAPVSAAIAGELKALSTCSLTLLEAAAVVGDPFEPDLAAETADVPEEQALDALDELLAFDLVRPTDVPCRFRFRHPIVRRAVYEGATTGWRIAAHGRAASALARRGASATARAHHVERSAHVGDDNAISLLADAGQAAAARAPASAAHCFQAALRLLPERKESAGLQVDLEARLATALAAAGRIEESRDALRALLERAPGDLGALRGQVVASCAMTEYLLRRHAEARALLEQALADLPDKRSREATALKLELASIGLWSGDHQSARRWAQRASEVARLHGDSALTMAAAVMLGMGYYLTGLIEEARACLREAAGLVDHLPDHELVERLDALAWLGWGQSLLGQPDRALPNLERGLRVARGSGQVPVVMQLLIGKACALLMLGHLEEAATQLDEAIEASRLTGSSEFRAWALGARCWVATLAGDLPRAIACGQGAVELAAGWEDLVSAASACYLADARLENGEPERARDEVLAGAGGPDLPLVAPAWRVRWYELLTFAELSLDRLEAAEGWAGRARETADQLGLAWSAGWADRAQAAVLLAAGETAAAAESADSAIEEFLASGDHVLAARSRTLAGRALAAAGRHEEAAASVEHALAELDEYRALRYRDEAAHELRLLGRRVPRRGRRGEPATGVHALSERERQVAELVAAGQRNRAIAAELFLSEKTVEKHLAHVFTKLGISSRAAVGAVLERGRSEADSAATNGG